MKPTSDNVLSRRRALAGAGAAGAAAAVAAVAAGSLSPAQPQPTVAADADRPQDDAGGYHVTEHIKRYYSTART